MSTFSDEHKKYLKQIKREKIVVGICKFLIIVLFLALWEVLVKYSFISSFMYSSPSRVMKTIFSLFNSGELFRHIGITLYEVFISFFMATVLGLIVATLMWSNRILSKIVDPYLTVLNSLPKVALGPLIIIWVGASTNSIIFMALMISSFVTIINIYNGFVNVNKNYIIMLKSFGASKWQIFRKIILPSNVLNIISSLKINVSMSLIGM